MFQKIQKLLLLYYNYDYFKYQNKEFKQIENLTYDLMSVFEHDKLFKDLIL